MMNSWTPLPSTTHLVRECFEIPQKPFGGGWGKARTALKWNFTLGT